MSEKNYDFRLRHWQYHKPGRRDPRRKAGKNEVMMTEDWSIGYASESDCLTVTAADDFRDYLEKSMGISLRIVHEDGPRVLWLEAVPKIKKGFALDAGKEHIRISAAEKMILRAAIHLEDMMNLEGAPVVPVGKMIRKPMYEVRIVHSGTGLDVFPDCELMALLHAGYDSIELFYEGPDRNHIGRCDFNDIITRAARLGIQTFFHNYVRTYVHPDEDGAQENFERFKAKFGKRIGECYVIHPRNLSLKDGITCIPPYMTMCL